MKEIKNGKRLIDVGILGALALGLTFQVACSGGNGAGQSSSELNQEQSNAPEGGQYAAEEEEDCVDGVATLDTFVADPDLDLLLAGLGVEDLPLVGDLLVSGNPDAIAVPAGFAPDPENPGQFVAISEEDANAFLTNGSIPADTPVLAMTPVVCDDTFAADPDPANLVAGIDPTDALALLPIFEIDPETEAEALVALVMVVVENPGAGDDPGAPELFAVEFPDEDEDPSTPEVPQALTDIIDELVGLLDA